MNNAYERTNEMVSHSRELHHILQVVMSEDFPAACVQATVHYFGHFFPCGGRHRRDDDTYTNCYRSHQCSVICICHLTQCSNFFGTFSYVRFMVSDSGELFVTFNIFQVDNSSWEAAFQALCLLSLHRLHEGDLWEEAVTGCSHGRELGVVLT